MSARNVNSSNKPAWLSYAISCIFIQQNGIYIRNIKTYLASGKALLLYFSVSKLETELMHVFQTTSGIT